MKLIVFSGLPGTGKSVLAETLGRELGIPVFAKDWRVIECICSDVSVHCERLEKRQRGISGWHELKWSDVEFVRSYYAPWNEERLIVDSVASVDQNMQAALNYCR